MYNLYTETIFFFRLTDEIIGRYYMTAEYGLFVFVMFFVYFFVSNIHYGFVYVRFGVRGGGEGEGRG